MFDPIDTDSELIFIPNEEYSFYANLEDLETNDNFNYWECSLYHADSLTKAFENVCILNKDIISGTDYRFYSTFTAPDVPNGCYYIIITDTVDSDNVLYISNKIVVQTDTTDTFLIRYRNAVDILNFGYENLTSYYNKFRIEIIKRQPLNPLTTEGYTLTSGDFKRVRTTKIKDYEWVTGFFGELKHDALNAGVFHSTFQVNHDNRWYTYRLGNGNYDVQWSENYGLAQALVRLEIADFASSNKQL